MLFCACINKDFNNNCGITNREIEALSKNNEHFKILLLVDKELNLFLRRIRLSEYFILGKEENINWEMELTNKNLCERYNIKYNANEYIFDKFELMKLPKNFLFLAKEPYGYYDEILSSDKNYYINLYNGELICNSVEKHYKHSNEDLHLVMDLNVEHSKISLIYKRRNNAKVYICNVPTVYLDLLGNENIHFENGFEIFLSEERLEKLADDYLSGEIVKYI